MTVQKQYDDHNVINIYVMARNFGRAVAEITVMLICTLFKFHLYAVVHSVCFRNKSIDSESSFCGTDFHFDKCYWILSSFICEISNHPFKITSAVMAVKCKRIVLDRKLNL